MITVAQVDPSFQRQTPLSSDDVGDDVIDKLPPELEFGHMEKILASQVKSLVEKAKLKGRVDGQKLARKLSYQRGKSTVSS